jgi:hypothetical protein
MPARTVKKQISGLVDRKHWFQYSPSSLCGSAQDFFLEPKQKISHCRGILLPILAIAGAATLDFSCNQATDFPV